LLLVGSVGGVTGRRVVAFMLMLREIADRYQEISDDWPTEPRAQQSADLAELDVLLLELAGLWACGLHPHPTAPRWPA